VVGGRDARHLWALSPADADRDGWFVDIFAHILDTAATSWSGVNGTLDTVLRQW
jgi:hypothetical protein